MQKIIVIFSFIIAVVVAIRNVVNSFLIEIDIKNGMDVKDATQKRKFRLRNFFKKRKNTDSEENTCQESK